MIGDHTFLHIITCLMDARKSLYACHSPCTWTGWTLAYSLIMPNMGRNCKFHIRWTNRTIQEEANLDSYFPLHVLNNFKLINFVHLSLKLIPNETPGNSAISANHSRAEYSLYFKVQINILELSTRLFQSTF